ncbi:MAG: DUF6531 domain-containing protein, partial [Acidobacteriota bacterium]
MAMKSMVKVGLAVLSVTLVLSAPAFAQSGIFDRIGVDANHGLHGTVPGENVDLFTGNLTLQFTDLSLPGPNGLGLAIQRVYNSKIAYDILKAGGVQEWHVRGEPRSWVGLGWSLHMGRLLDWEQEGMHDVFDVVIEFPDGRRETAFQTENANGVRTFMTKSFLKLVHGSEGWVLYFQDGTKWYFGAERPVEYAQGGWRNARVVTSIVNTYGNAISVDYYDGNAAMQRITDALGRKVEFTVNDPAAVYPKLTAMTLLYQGNVVRNYQYVVKTDSTLGDVGGVYYLDSFDPPELAAETYEYILGGVADARRYGLKAVNTPFAGRVEYEYDSHDFVGLCEEVEGPEVSRSRCDSLVLKSKTVHFGFGGGTKTWSYQYPSYDTPTVGSENDTVTVTGPEYVMKVRYNNGPTDPAWKHGLLASKSYADNSFREEYEWEAEVLTTRSGYPSANYIMAPLTTSTWQTVLPGVTTREVNVYDNAILKKHGLPTRVEHWGKCGTPTRLSYDTFEYACQSVPGFWDRYMLALVSDQSTYDAGGSLLKRTQTTYDALNGAIDAVTRRVDAGTNLTWDHTYSQADGGRTVTVKVDPPGDAARAETRTYSYGVLASVVRPDYTELTRTIDPKDSSIISETNQHGGTMSFSYDGLGRVRKITIPRFDTVTADWGPNTVTIKRGKRTVEKYWDGFGRSLGSEEKGDGKTLYYRRNLDGEGRVSSETKGSEVNSPEYSYTYTYYASGELATTIDPEGKRTGVTFDGCDKVVNDGNGRNWRYTYQRLPGQITGVKEPGTEGGSATNTYDALGRLMKVVYNDTQTRTFDYNDMDQVTQETHPETGTISYNYSASTGNLDSKVWEGTTTSYAYNHSSQLKKVDSGDETVEYFYDDGKGRVNRVISTKGWSRKGIDYNDFGSVKTETVNIPGLSPKRIVYDYDTSNNLNWIKYPDQKIAETVYNGMDAPEKVTHNLNALIDQAEYGAYMLPVKIPFVGNSTSFETTYYKTGHLKRAKLVTAEPRVLYNAEYLYDGNYNITSIQNTTPSMNAGFTYDALNRLVKATYSQGNVAEYKFGYDGFGNMLTAQEDAKQLPKTYTARNQIEGFLYDPRGNLTSDGVLRYAWDNLNRLSEVRTAPSPASPSGDLMTWYFYDDRGLRFKTVRLPQTQQGTLHLTYPNGGEVLQGGEVCNITWDPVPAGVEYLKIEWRQGGGDWQQIPGGEQWVASLGAFPWDLPIPAQDLTQCFVRIVNVDAPTQWDRSDTSFTIKA